MQNRKANKIASWKHKQSSWQQFEPQASELGHIHLHRQIQGSYLHAGEAECHKPYGDEFHIFYNNHILSSLSIFSKDKVQAKRRRAGTQAVAHVEIENAISSLRLQYCKPFGNTTVLIQIIQVRSFCIACSHMSSVRK